MNKENIVFMRMNYFLILILCAIASCKQQKKIRPAEEKLHFFVDSATNTDDPERRMAYGLNITPPWPDGGSIFVNLPEHLWYMPDTKGIARHHDQRKNVWKVSKDGTSASYDVESILEPGVRLSVKGNAEKDRAYFEMTITNNSSTLLKEIGPLFCFQYHPLKGFPLARSDNFAHTFVVMNGKPVALKDIKVDSAGAIARMAQVSACGYGLNTWAEKMGGMIEEPIDMALTALTSSTDDRKAIVSWTPGKSILSNTVIPCIHADPCIGDLAQGESRTVRGVLIFTRNSIESVIRELTEKK
ncbi:MAG: hypothetical protein JNL51_17820 [Chitinophagaceae bacterium]|nr:hypothetical protein [Chitinophagaceae bacterium]